MPLGIQRLNARHQPPNSRIVFIKPLPGPTCAFAQDFLERIAAICHPIMKANHLSIMSLEEYEPNPEFVGRNFNAGEIIQLVLKAPYTGHWLSFRSVQLVMMHELAHCVQMNHSGAFWKVRNQLAGELRELWAKGYTGDGFWGRGKTLLSGQYEPAVGLEAEALPRSLCGGTFRSSRGRKRKRKGGEKKTLSYAERQQRRIAKKFGANGITLGDDEDTRVKLEDGKKPKGKPRVAGSARGRELRAAAALARFGQQQDDSVKKEEEMDSGSETESDYEDSNDKNEAIDLDGSRLLDAKGNGMVKVCENEDSEDVHVKEEMQELHDINSLPQEPEEAPGAARVKQERPQEAENISISSDQELTNSTHQLAKPPKERTAPCRRIGRESTNTVVVVPPQLTVPQSTTKVPLTPNTCPICSLSNPSSATLCLACSHVLLPSTLPGTHWSCQSPTCKDSRYINAGDCGVCGVCGVRKPTMMTTS